MCVTFLNVKATPTGFEPVRAEPNGLAGRRLNHSAKVSISHCVIEYICDSVRTYVQMRNASATGNRTPGICVTGRDVTNYTIADYSILLHILTMIKQIQCVCVHS